MIRRQHAFLALVLLGAAAIPSACSLPYAYIADGSGGEAGATGDSGGGSSALGTGGANPNDGGGSGGADSGGGSGGDGATGATGGGGDASTSGGGSGSDSGGNGTGGGVSTDVTVRLEEVRQLIRGFGINNAFYPVAFGSSVAQRLFGSGADDLDLNILRVAMEPDGTAVGGADCYADIDAAHDLGAEYIIGTVYTPPATYKSNTSTVDGGHLKPENYVAWATTIAAFADVIAANTDEATLYAMSPQHQVDFATCNDGEPCTDSHESAVMTGYEAAEFQKEVGQKLRDKDVIPMSPEPSLWRHLWSNRSASGTEPSGLDGFDPLGCGFPTGTEGPTGCTPGTPFTDGYEYGRALHADPNAWAAFDIMATHQYFSQVAEPWPSDVPRGEKELWMTDMGGIKWWPEQGEIQGVAPFEVSPTTHIANGVAVARWVHDGLVNGEANAWVWFWYQAKFLDDNSGLVTKDGDTAKRFYTFGNFTRHVKPDSHRVNMTGEVPDDVLLSAYLTADSKVVVVAINETTEQQDIPITIVGDTASPTAMTPIVTSVSENWATKTPVPLTDGIFDAALPAMSVTTFVSD